MRSRPSSVSTLSTVLPLVPFVPFVPLHSLITASDLTAPAVHQRWCACSANRARSNGAFLPLGKGGRLGLPGALCNSGPHGTHYHFAEEHCQAQQMVNLRKPCRRFLVPGLIARAR